MSGTGRERTRPADLWSVHSLSSCSHLTLCPHAPCTPGIYDPAFIAANQESRADNLIKGSRQQQLETVRQQIREFKASSGVDKVRAAVTAAAADG